MIRNPKVTQKKNQDGSALSRSADAARPKTKRLIVESHDAGTPNYEERD